MEKIQHYPDLAYHSWKDTISTVHMWTQIVGKVRLQKTPWINHSWHVTLYVTPEGMTTGKIPNRGKPFEIRFDFRNHKLNLLLAEQTFSFTLEAMSVAGFYQKLMQLLADAGIHVQIYAKPNEVDPAIPFAENTRDSSYDRERMEDFHRVLLSVDRVMTTFRSKFKGKSSPPHFFWGAFDMAVTRFSGRPAPAHPGGMPNLPDVVVREAYSHELHSCGFWPGNEMFPEAAFYAYAYPEPKEFPASVIRPIDAYYHRELKEWILPYDAVKDAQHPDLTLLDFFETTFHAAAETGGWDLSYMF